MSKTETTPSAGTRSYRDALNRWGVGLGVAGLICVASLPATLEAQYFSSGLMLLLVWTMSLIWRNRPSRAGYEVIRVAMILISLAMSLRYLIWRGAETLPLTLGIAAVSAGLLLFVAECYCFLVSALGHLPNLRKTLRTPIPLPTELAALPVVDVYITTYNEDPELVRSTIIAATQLRYPNEKLHVYVLDDGGTGQMISNPEHSRATQARQRSKKIQAIASQCGASYLTRERNDYAKAGNLNAALTQTRGDFIVVLDCDHVPAEDFIEKTLGFFLVDPKLFLVQTPHHLINPDPLERNLATFHHSPAENDLFYNTIQPGLDAWGATFFCGSAAMLRRAALDDIGGFSQDTLSEDAETTLRALSRGYTTVYLNLPLISGLQPETFSGFIQQRARWGQGMWQIFMFHNPWRLPGLSLMQRMLFTNFALFWGFPVSRLVMLMMPILTLLLSVPLADARVIDVLAYGAPALLCSTLTTQFVYGKLRWPFISYLYEVIQSVHLTAGIAHLLRNPRAPQFKVTPKGEILEKDCVSTLATPFYLLCALSFAALVMGAYHLQTQPATRDATAFVSAWALLDLLFFLCALGVTLERRQRRAHPRASVSYPVHLRTEHGVELKGTLQDASATGAGVLLTRTTASEIPLKPAMGLEIQVEGIPHKLYGRLQKMHVMPSGELSLGLVYCFRHIEQERAAVAIPYASSQQLLNNLERRHRQLSVITAFLTLLKKAIVHGGCHLMVIITSMIKQIEDAWQPVPSSRERS
ncbi:MAG: UDP-forming cellulose synthase catalytic subunit [Oxalobacteraceae bacterium]